LAKPKQRRTDATPVSIQPPPTLLTPPALPITPTEIAALQTKFKDLVERYIQFRVDPTNDRYADTKFCSENGIDVTLLEKLKTIEVMKRIHGHALEPKEIDETVNTLLRLAYGKSIQERTPPIKSLEGLLNAFVNLLKIQQLQAGNPTERISIEDLREKTADEVHSFIGRHLVTHRN
jgi:hypothetical protein